MNKFLIANQVPNSYGMVSNQIGVIVEIEAKSREQAIELYSAETKRYNCSCIGELIANKAVIDTEYLEIIKLKVGQKSEI